MVVLKEGIQVWNENVTFDTIVACCCCVRCCDAETRSVPREHGDNNYEVLVGKVAKLPNPTLCVEAKLPREKTTATKHHDHDDDEAIQQKNAPTEFLNNLRSWRFSSEFEVMHISNECLRRNS